MSPALPKGQGHPGGRPSVFLGRRPIAPAFLSKAVGQDDLHDRWGYGTSWGAAYGLIQRTAPGPPLRRGLLFGTGVWALSYVTLVPVGLYQPPWKYPSALVLDLSSHL